MSSTMADTRSPSTSISKSDKIKKPAKVVVLRLPPERLAQFEEKPQPKQEESSHTSEAPSPPPATNGAPTLKVTESADAPSEPNSTPAPAPASAPDNATSTSTDPPKKRKGPAPGFKRNIALTSDGTPKPRGKPGPKKKPRLEDGTIDHNTKPANVTAANHKLGPKANQGAINAGLRALDRSGKPCRKWSRKPFSVKSFTGVAWDMPSWRGLEKQYYLNGDDSSETKDISMQSSSEVKPTESDIAMESNHGDPNDLMAISTSMASSPPPLPAQAAIVAT